MLFTSGDRIVFTGDSVTDAGRGRPVGEGLWQGVGDGYVRTIDNILNVVYPDWRLWVSNTGTGGDTSRSLKKRWQEDVMNLKPDWVSLMIGINDIWRQFDTPTIPEQHVYPAEYRENLCEMLERTHGVSAIWSCLLSEGTYAFVRLPMLSYSLSLRMYVA